MKKEYTLIRIHTERGKAVYREELSSYLSYNPLDFISDIRTDSGMHNIPRVMCRLDMLYGTMEKSGRFEVARQHKFTAPKTYISYEIRVSDISW